MKKLAVLLALLATACTFSPSDTGQKAEFHPPIVYANWRVGHDAAGACALSSGYNGLIVVLRNGAVSVQSNRDMAPGASLDLNVAGQRFQTDDAAFSPKDSAEIVALFKQGGKAYLEWSEMNSSLNQARNHVNNVLKLDDFAKQWQQCTKPKPQTH